MDCLCKPDECPGPDECVCILCPASTWCVVASTLLQMQEPWQGRFLCWMAQQAGDWSWNGRVPELRELSAWLMQRPELCRTTLRLLRSWTGNLLPMECTVPFRRWACSRHGHYQR